MIPRSHAKTRGKIPYRYPFFHPQLWSFRRHGRKEALRSFRSCSIRHPILVSTRARYSARYMPIVAHSQLISSPLHSRAENRPYPARSHANIRPKTDPFLSQSCPGLIMDWKQTRIISDIRPILSHSQPIPGQIVGCSWHKIEPDRNLQMGNGQKYMPALPSGRLGIYLFIMTMDTGCPWSFFLTLQPFHQSPATHF